jgi:hypothetical protein
MMSLYINQAINLEEVGKGYITFSHYIRVRYHYGIEYFILAYIISIR